ncbi:MAG: sigma-70 family RNA polymerase sigma factor [Candidatus Cloacimonetes bacterium]|nr:sigma-70 family RNA polymerase sigma factor [Candidatus Cloacimonadota bacterium]
MEKEKVDKIIVRFKDKIFGFALTKTQNIDSAEELASRILFDVYSSLIKAETIGNIDGYIYRVSCNVYARFVDEEKRSENISQYTGYMSTEQIHDIHTHNDDIFQLMRQEISYLAKIQRNVILMFYYQKMKQHEIAKQLNITIATVKWHLYDARNLLKERIMSNEERNIGLNPIEFEALGHIGGVGPEKKETTHYLQKLLSQNIVYAAYQKAKSITQIAQELNVAAAYIEDEVACLTENGFLDKVAGSKYLANMLITELSKEVLEAEHQIYIKFAQAICKEYIPLVIKAFEDFQKKGFYSPQNDLNFLLWSVVSYACGNKLLMEEQSEIRKYYTKRIDGGEYIATGILPKDFDWSGLNYDPDLHTTCGDMHRSNHWNEAKDHFPVYAWQLNTYYDTREGGWQENRYSDYLYLNEFILGKLTKELEQIDKYKRLIDKGYIICENKSEYANMVITTKSAKEFRDMLPEAPDTLRTTHKDMASEIVKINLKQYPAHIKDMASAWHKLLLTDRAKTRVLELLLQNGVLKPLNDNQKKSVNTIMFSDALPI